FHVANALVHAPVGYAFERRAIIEILCNSHVVVERHIFRHVTEMGASLERLLEDVETCDRRTPRSRRHEAGKNPHGCSLAGAIWSEKPHDLALADFEIQILDRRL